MGEHGKGYRSEYGPEFFGEELFTELRRVKAAFDPHNKMNPGKICTPLDTPFELVKVSDTKRGFTIAKSTSKCATALSKRWSVTVTVCALTTKLAPRCVLQ